MIDRFEFERWRHHKLTDPIPNDMLDNLEENIIDAPTTSALLAEVRRLRQEIARLEARDKEQAADAEFDRCHRSGNPYGGYT